MGEYLINLLQVVGGIFKSGGGGGGGIHLHLKVHVQCNQRKLIIYSISGWYAPSSQHLSGVTHTCSTKRDKRVCYQNSKTNGHVYTCMLQN